MALNIASQFWWSAAVNRDPVILAKAMVDNTAKYANTLRVTDATIVTTPTVSSGKCGNVRVTYTIAAEGAGDALFLTDIHNGGMGAMNTMAFKSTGRISGSFWMYATGHSTRKITLEILSPQPAFAETTLQLDCDP